MDPIPSYSFGWSARDPHLRKDQASPWHILAASNNTLGVNSPKFITRTQLAKCTSPELSKKKHHLSEQPRKILIRSSMKPDWFMRGSLSSLLIIPFKKLSNISSPMYYANKQSLGPCSSDLASFMNPEKNGSFRNVEHNPDGI